MYMAPKVIGSVPKKDNEIWPWERRQCSVQGRSSFRRTWNSASNWTISTSVRHHSTAHIDGQCFGANYSTSPLLLRLIRITNTNTNITDAPSATATLPPILVAFHGDRQRFPSNLQGGDRRALEARNEATPHGQEG
jgi:hypothetical protein